MKKQLSVLSLAILAWFPASAFAQCNDVVFWNKLGSVEEVENSEIGPGLQLTSYIFSDWQEAQISPAQFGNGLYVNHDTGEGWTNDGGNFFALDLHEIGLTPERGTIELWFQFEYDASVHNHAYFFQIRNALTNHFPDANSQTNVVIGAGWNGWDYGSYGKRFFVGINDGSNAPHALTADYSAAPGGALEFGAGTKFHFGFVWDVDGIDGSDDTLRLYVNGDVEASTTDSLPTAGGFDPYLYLGSPPSYGSWDHHYNAVKGVTDNLVIWSCARTDFSHRFEEDPLPPQLSIASEIPAAESETVAVDVDFTANGESIAAATFSIDYDQSCLFFDDTDFNGDGIPDNLVVQVPGAFTVTAFHDLGDSDGEIDVSILDLAPPFATLPDGVLVTATFIATCEPEVGSYVDAPVLFSGDPAATFSDDLAQDVGGATVGGSVRIYPGPRGDCNATGELAAADVVATVLEIFDGDGDFWGDVPGGTYPGSPVGCDSNADTDVTAGDVSCTILLYFGGSCGAAERWPPMAASRGPVLGIDGTPRLEPGSTIRVPVRLSSSDHALSSVTFSLDLDSSRLRFDATDADRDGVPDAVRFPAGPPLLAQVRFDLRDREGELDLALAAEPGAFFADGVLLELELVVRHSGRLGKSLGFSEAPGPSFGDLTGRGVPGRGIVTWKPIRDLPPAPTPRSF